jgi:molecular chaperone HtpG
MTAQAETQPFQAEVQELLDLMIHSLYTHQEIFLRELISNASDALDKLRVEALTNSELLGSDEKLTISLELDADSGCLSILDNGIGMDRDDLVQGLGTIASSGTRRFLEELKERGADDAPELIGQFGVGFYASFMVADKVIVETSRENDGAGWRWTSSADGSYTIEEVAGLERGTRVELHLKEDGPREEYLHEHKLRELVRRYSDFVEHPIMLGDDQLNSQKPIWIRPKSEVTSEEHAEFYRHLTHDFQEPLETIHFQVEGALEYTALLYIPRTKPMDLFSEKQHRSRLSLYVRRVQIAEECEDLLPPWLRFVRGVVEASDLPLNVSREVMQTNPHVRAIRSRLVKKIISTLETMLEKNREDYEVFWASFGAVIKEGICAGDNEDNRLSKICLFRSTHGDDWTTLQEYQDRAPKEQDALWTITGGGRAALAASPHLETFRAKGFEVLYFDEPVDEWLLDALGEVEGQPFKSVHSADSSLQSEADEKVLEKQSETFKELFEKLAEHFGDEVESVCLTSRLTGSAALLTSAAGAPRPHMERMLREMHGAAPPTARILELGANHPLVVQLGELFAANPGDPAILDTADLLYGQALIAEGGVPVNPARFNELLCKLMLEGAPTKD